MNDKKKLKIGVKQGGGPAPGYFWGVVILDMAYNEAMRFLSEDQYCHVAGLVKVLASEEDPSHSVICSVKPIEDFFELREKGGILGNINTRVFFFLENTLPENKNLVVLGAIKKENEDQTPRATVIRMERRKRMYLEGDLEK